MIQATASSADNISAIRESMAEEVRSLSIVRNLRFVMDVVLQWCVIGLSIALAVWFESWVVYLLAILVIATRQHALGVLMHDGTHYRLLTNRTANDFVCDLLCALPVGMLTSRYRHEHLLHHRFLNTDDDPYWRDYLLFFEYYHGDNGAGLGAMHQTGWTGFIANIVDRKYRARS